MYQVVITGYRLAEASHGKPYHVYCINVLETSSGQRCVVEKRYSEFSALHRLLKKENPDTAPFPPKRVRNSQPKVLEQRRIALESYIQKMLKLSTTKQQVLNFLGLESKSTGNCRKRMIESSNHDRDDHSRGIGHRPILTFHCDPYVQSLTDSSLSDIVTNGVLLGIYKL